MAGPHRKGQFIASPDGYAVVNTGSTVLACRRCGKFSSLKNNQAIHDELQRQGDPIWDRPGLRCPDLACKNHAAEIGDAGFRKFGKTRSGSPRFQCRACAKTISVGKATLRQRQPHKNATVFSLLINHSPLNRICEVADLSFTSLYGKIDFIYEQCRAFAADRERRLAEMSFDRRYLCTDRQDYLVNWNDRTEKKTIQLTAVATADLDSGYIFGLMPNFDPSVSPEKLENLWRLEGDGDKPIPLRTTARLWTDADYAASASKSVAALNLDAEAAEDVTNGQQLPKSGCQVHADYLMHGHYQLLRHHFRGAEKLRFFLDQDSGLLGASHQAAAATSDRPRHARSFQPSRLKIVHPPPKRQRSMPSPADAPRFPAHRDTSSP